MLNQINFMNFVNVLEDKEEFSTFVFKKSKGVLSLTHVNTPLYLTDKDGKFMALPAFEGNSVIDLWFDFEIKTNNMLSNEIKEEITQILKQIEIMKFANKLEETLEVQKIETKKHKI